MLADIDYGIDFNENDKDYNTKIKIYSGKMKGDEAKSHKIRMWITDDINQKSRKEAMETDIANEMKKVK